MRVDEAEQPRVVVRVLGCSSCSRASSLLWQTVWTVSHSRGLASCASQWRLSRRYSTLGHRRLLRNEAGAPCLSPRSAAVASHLQPEPEQPCRSDPERAHRRPPRRSPPTVAPSPGTTLNRRNEATARHDMTSSATHCGPVTRSDYPTRVHADHCSERTGRSPYVRSCPGSARPVPARHWRRSSCNNGVRFGMHRLELIPRRV